MEATSHGWVLRGAAEGRCSFLKRAVWQRKDKHTHCRGFHGQHCPASRVDEQCKALRQRSGLVQCALQRTRGPFACCNTKVATPALQGRC